MITEVLLHYDPTASYCSFEYGPGDFGVCVGNKQIMTVSCRQYSYLEKLGFIGMPEEGHYPIGAQGKFLVA